MKKIIIMMVMMVALASSLVAGKAIDADGASNFWSNTDGGITAETITGSTFIYIYSDGAIHVVAKCN